MDPIQRNALFTRIAIFLSGVTVYLFLVVAGLMQLRGEMGLPSRSRQGCLAAGLILAFATLFAVVPLLPGSWEPKTPYEISKQAAAPFMLVIVVLFFVGYVGWTALEIVRTVQWLRAGRPRPPAPPPPISRVRARGATPAQRASVRRSGRHRGRR